MLQVPETADQVLVWLGKGQDMKVVETTSDFPGAGLID
jgi:hypothetical protein